MRKIKLFILIIFSSSYLFSQKNKITMTSINKDTLWIIECDLGRCIEKAWEFPLYKEKKPKIIMVEVLPHYASTREKKKKNKLKG